MQRITAGRTRNSQEAQAGTALDTHRTATTKKQDKGIYFQLH